MDERTLEKTQQQHMLYQQEQHHQILHQQIQVLEPEPDLLKSSLCFPALLQIQLPSRSWWD